MSILNKILICICALTILGALGFIAYKQYEISVRQTAIETQVVKQKELSDSIMRSQNEYATKDDIEKFIKSNGASLKVIQDDLKSLHAEISAANVVSVHSSGQKGSNIPSTGTGGSNPNPTNSDTYGYLKNTQTLSLNEKFNIPVPIGQVGFSAWQPSPWNVNIFPREYKVVSVIGTDENQRTYVYNKFSVKVDNKDYDVKIASSETKQEYPDSKWSFWSPRLYIGADGGIDISTVPTISSQIKGQFVPSINFGFISYGQFKRQPIFSVAQVGIGASVIDAKPKVIVTPIAYNIGQHVPFISNTYIGPSVGIGFNGSVDIMAGIRIGL